MKAIINTRYRTGTMAFLATGFQEADMDDSGTLITCLDAISTHPFFIGVKDESFRRLHISPEMRILEIGCGTGIDARKMAVMAGTEGLVVGVDPGLNMLREARKGREPCGRVSGSEIPEPVYARMDGRALAFPDSSFDVVREDRALQHIRDHQHVLREMIRVLKPSGRFALFEPDWELFIIDGSDRSLTRTILNFWTDRFMNGWIGRELYRLCLDCGARTVSVLPRTMIMHDLLTCERIFGIRDTVFSAIKSGVIEETAGWQWLSDLEAADRCGRFFSSFTGYLVTGEKP